MCVLCFSSPHLQRWHDFFSRRRRREMEKLNLSEFGFPLRI